MRKGKKESSSFRPIPLGLGMIGNTRGTWKSWLLACLTLPRSPSLLWRSSERPLGGPHKTRQYMVGNWSAKGVVLGRGCAADEVPSLERMDQANGIACWSVTPPRRFGLSSRRCDPDAAPLPLAAHRVRVHEYSSPARFVEQAVLFDFHMEPLEIWDLRDPGRPLWAGGDQPRDRFLTGQDVGGLL